MDLMYCGDTLVVDLDTGRAERVPFTGLADGRPGLPAGIDLYREHEEADPLVLGSGLLTGTTTPASCLGFMLGRSPLNGEPAAAPLTLFAGAEVKLSGFSMVVVRGGSSRPVYLWLHDGVADVLDASELWGLDTWRTTDAVRREMGEPLIQVISAGPAGEAGSKAAAFSVNYWGSGDSAALGAVMGGKNLKAVAVRGLGMLDAADPQGYYEASAGLLGRLPSDTGFEAVSRGLGADDLDAWLEPLVHRHRSCFACPSACAKFVKYREDPGVMDASGVEEPGMLLTGAAPAMWLRGGGWEAGPACLALEAMSRAGVDMTRGARELAPNPLADEAAIADAVAGLGGGEAAGWPAGPSRDGGLFGPWVPPLSGEGAWLEACMVGYTVGVCPLYILTAGVDTGELLGLCGPAAGIELDVAAVREMFA